MKNNGHRGQQYSSKKGYRSLVQRVTGPTFTSSVTIKWTLSHDRSKRWFSPAITVCANPIPNPKPYPRDPSDQWPFGLVNSPCKKWLTVEYLDMYEFKLIVLCRVWTGAAGTRVGEGVIVIWGQSTSFFSETWSTCYRLPAGWWRFVHHSVVKTWKKHHVPCGSLFYWRNVWIVSSVVDLWLWWPAGANAWTHGRVGWGRVPQQAQSFTSEIGVW